MPAGAQSQPGATAQGGQQLQGQSPHPTAQPPRPERPRLEPVTIGDIVETDVVTAQRDTPVATVVSKMAEMDVGSIVVVEDDRPVGMITDRDVALALEDTPDLTDRPVDDLLVGDPVTATVEMNVFDVVRRLGDESVRRLPIVADDGTLEGIVTLDDILVLLEAELGNVADIIKTQSPRL